MSYTRGSSPLTRGKRELGGVLLLDCGLIPAHAGKTCRHDLNSHAPRAHPRSRGENILSAMASLASLGSSPLTRGKRADHMMPTLLGGLIPAHAGKTPGLRRPPPSHRAHPRSRGENSKDGGFKWLASGSSPLTRGKPRRALHGLRESGLIPAHAGKTRGQRYSSVTSTAHPRSRGENTLRTLQQGTGPGSSPLTRGKRRARRRRGPRAGLIPAHAGKTPKQIRTVIMSGAHPRSRGENQGVGRELGKVEGSSPLTRGKRLFSFPHPVVGGLIPAHAGKTRRLRSRQETSRAHPRSRGENVLEEIGGNVEKGSSPLTRGKHRRSARDR